MNKKGQALIGTLLITAIGIIIGAILLSDSIADNVNLVTSTFTVSNTTVAGLSGTATNLIGKHATDLVVTNKTGGGVIQSGNFTINNDIILSDGTLGSTIVTAAGNTINASTAGCCNISYIYQPLGYFTDGGSRSIATVIVIFCAIAIAITALVPVLRNGALDLVGVK